MRVTRKYGITYRDRGDVHGVHRKIVVEARNIDGAKRIFYDRQPNSHRYKIISAQLIREDVDTNRILDNLMVYCKKHHLVIQMFYKTGNVSAVATVIDEDDKIRTLYCRKNKWLFAEGSEEK